MSTFQNARFYTTVNHMKDLPPTRAEVAFVGRSNAGKSSAINTLANHARLARVSKTPGRTQHINFFELGNECFLVDLPGYGYAEVPEAVRAHWVELLGRYLQSRQSLIGLLLIMDARHPLKELDRKMLEFFRVTRRPVHILLSKADKLSRQEQSKVLALVKRELNDYPDVSVQMFSSLKKSGVEDVERVVNGWFGQYMEPPASDEAEPPEL
ncbi:MULTISPECIES: ribosome biogenesis GTP-binding protein YihA/YsxC [Chromobacterium]|uniref:Probable GTP-binding protein EngB n=2 Tax=Chromobacterium TaxID=535 RepID=A0ABS3GNB4_9NEIS|nr:MULTISPECIES: ribosome biogenesis GTP-binding protein YihA/YsxC [Chromobacterium]AXT44873.1 YihA family ribosome biogenesis GTP-binding protein [Chromobacterium rhizoryzae]MBK0414698.1 YihA family ribosome biogenesis GTP-binding protein [Chromobacterium haemolyticum]MBO0416077.1 YihA family ribosome biogenesis GTP-binding protein [Chromobacterium haemolyticum]MBO0499424.1 YihA family ribosome biogenesis GTP-binding protein [Chromobacterium haemolyticum]MDH0342937.1 ribosome biogenesis GTP-b